MSNETGHEIQRLAIQLASGSIAYDEIVCTHGDEFATQVVAFAGTNIAGYVAGEVYDIARETPVIGEVLDISADIVGEVAEDLIDGFFGLW